MGVSQRGLGGGGGGGARRGQVGQGGNGELLPRNGYLHPGQKRLSESGVVERVDCTTTHTQPDQTRKH